VDLWCSEYKSVADILSATEEFVNVKEVAQRAGQIAGFCKESNKRCRTVEERRFSATSIESKSIGLLSPSNLARINQLFCRDHPAKRNQN
jgi:hypothetical protein